MRSTDPYDGWITLRPETSGRYADQWFIDCRCGWHEQAAGNRVAGNMATAHVAEHGVVVPAPASAPQPAVPAGPQPQTAWDFAARVPR